MTDALEARLRAVLYRFDCPSPHTLGEYELAALEPEDHTRVARHLLDCEPCMAELDELRAYLRKPEPALHDPLVQRLARVVARLVSPAPEASPATSGLRQAGGETDRVYEANGLRVRLSISPSATYPAALSLVGMILGSDADTPLQGSVHLRSIDPPPLDATEDIGEFGEFAIDGLPPGRYRLELQLSECVVEVESIQLQAS